MSIHGPRKSPGEVEYSFVNGNALEWTMKGPRKVLSPKQLPADIRALWKRKIKLCRNSALKAPKINLFSLHIYSWSLLFQSPLRSAVFRDQARATLDSFIQVWHGSYFVLFYRHQYNESMRVL